MRLRFAVLVPVAALLACTSGSGDGPTSTAAPRPTSQAPTSDRPGSAGPFGDWPTYHGDALRTGYAKTMPPVSGAPQVVARFDLDGDVYASPLVVAGRIIVATENDSVYAIDDGHIAWRAQLGTPAPQDQLPCGNIFPLGITGTPVFDDGTIYVAAEFEGSPPRHELIALRMSDGHVLWRRGLDLPGVDPAAMQERGALTVADGRVWVPFGGLYGDCGDYKGRLVGVRLHGSGPDVAYTVPTAREAGIWAPPGPVWDDRYLYVQVGNGAATSGDPYDKSDSVLAITTDATVHQFFAPTTWPEDNAGDLDLGTQSPALVGRWVVAVGKRGTAYVLDRDHLGGIGGAVSSVDLCTSFGGAAQLGDRMYVPCTDGIRAVRVDETGHVQVLWHASPDVWGSPVVGGGRVWALNPDSGTLYTLDPTNGAVIDSVSVGETSRFATPAIYGSQLFVPTLDGLTVVRTS
ncbi:MAG TPA: PQQ-binding-like beta-propeller repeat protein [Jatrophihabitans sp.]|jgi:outer membrane protein assembly factor BamB|nr:PQQ-binding-like beta-propeller repeat protein [Jatrophihabitans sp.]